MWRITVEADGIRLAAAAAPADPLPIDQRLNALERDIAQFPAALWLIDASSIPLLSSEAIAILIGISRTISTNGGRLVLARPTASVAAVLRATRLTRLLPLMPDFDAARQALRALTSTN